MTASKAFQAFVLDRVSACLKRHGFAKKGNTFRRRRAEVCHVISVQKSGKSASEAVVFTMNLGVASLRLLARSEVEFDKCTIDDCHWRQRLASVSPRAEDVWWTVRDDASADAASAEVMAWLDTHGVAALGALPDDAALRDLWLSGRAPGLTEMQRLVNASLLAEALGPESAKSAIVRELQEMAQAKPLPAITARLRELGESP
jgi:hypothetical protein